MPAPSLADSIPTAVEGLAAGGRMAPRWYEFMRRLVDTVSDPFPLAQRTVAGLPRNPPDGRLAFVTDAGGGACPAYSVGGQWLRVSDNSVVS